MSRADVTVVIPAYNEEKHILASVLPLKTNAAIREIIVVDDGSDDETSSLAEKAGARVIKLPGNLGKGQAVMAAVPFINGEIVLLLDADLSGSAQAAADLLEPVRAGRADMAVAKFPNGSGGRGFGLAKGLARCGIGLLTGTFFEAPLSGQRCMKKRVLIDLMPLAGRYGLEVGLSIDALRLGYKITEVDGGSLGHCSPGRDLAGFLHRGRQFIDISAALLYRLPWKK